MTGGVSRWVFWPVRKVAGALVLAYDRWTRVEAVVRSPEKQAEIDRATEGLSLYHFEACPFCVKVRRHIRKLGLKIELRDVKRNKQFERELVAEGGQFQVPCLRVAGADGAPDWWMYESDDINAYLDSRFGLPK